MFPVTKKRCANAHSSLLFHFNCLSSEKVTQKQPCLYVIFNPQAPEGYFKFPVVPSFRDPKDRRITSYGIIIKCKSPTMMHYTYTKKRCFFAVELHLTFH